MPTLSLKDDGAQGAQMATVAPVDVDAVVLYSYPTSHTHAEADDDPAAKVVDPTGQAV